jgi:non-heme chloroperoxidase
MLLRAAFLALAILAFARLPALAAADTQDRFFVTSDGVRLHYLEAGQGHTIVLVPGWTMPAWIWQAQIDYFARAYHVVALDPRSQGDSEITWSGDGPLRRAEDIAELIARASTDPVLLVGWSLGVLDALAYVHTHGDGHIAGLVLIDNSVGENPPPVPERHPRGYHKPSYDEWVELFVRGMFQNPLPAGYLDRLTETALRTPKAIAHELLAYPLPRTYWRAAIYSTVKPILYVVRPRLAGQAANLQANHPGAETVIFPAAGHALFVDEADRFNALMEDFIRRRLWR